MGPGNRVFIFSSGWTGTHLVGQRGLELVALLPPPLTQVEIVNMRHLVRVSACERCLYFLYSSTEGKLTALRTTQNGCYR